MKKIYTVLIFVIITKLTQAQIGLSPISMTGGSGMSNTRPRITLNKDHNPVVTWNKTTDKTVYFSAWNGTSFATPIKLTPAGVQADVFTWAGQEIDGKEDSIYIVYASLSGTQSNIYLHKSIDGGNSFSDSIRVTNIGTDKARFPTIGINGLGNPIVAYMRMDSLWNGPAYVVTTSMNGGSNFMPDVDASNLLTGNEVCDCCPSTIVSYGNIQAMLFRDNASNARNTVATFSYNNGSSFDSICTPDFNNWVLNACPSTGPDGYFGTDSLYTVFASGAVTPMQVFISATHPTTLITGSHQTISSSPEMQNFPRIAGIGDTIGIVWEQAGKAMFSYSINGISNLSSAMKINDSIGTAAKPDIAFANGVFHMVWQNSNGVVHYRTFHLNTTNALNDVLPSNLNVFPNPSNSIWKIENQNNDNIQRIKITNSKGETVIDSKTLNSSAQIDLPCHEYANGIYFLNIEIGNKNYNVKLIKD